MRVLPHTRYLLALEGRLTAHGRPLPTKKEAQTRLRRLTGQDFGDDVAAWKAWIKKNRKRMYGRNQLPERLKKFIDGEPPS